VGLLLTRAALCKVPWLAKIEVDADWPMRGIPRVLHLDNAPEFKSRSLRSGCREYGIDLLYRPVGRAHFGGHIDRLNRTLMERVRGLPGATASSPKGRVSGHGPPALAELMDSISARMDTASKINDLQQLSLRRRGKPPKTTHRNGNFHFCYDFRPSLGVAPIGSRCTQFPLFTPFKRIDSMVRFKISESAKSGNYDVLVCHRNMLTDLIQ
jgi:hypothetical protein